VLQARHLPDREALVLMFTNMVQETVQPLSGHAVASEVLGQKAGISNQETVNSQE
jgi:hypothetical protein